MPATGATAASGGIAVSAFDGPVGTDTAESGPGSNAGSGLIGGGGVAALGAAAGLRIVAFGPDVVVVVVAVVVLASAVVVLVVAPVDDTTDDGDGAGAPASEAAAEAIGVPRTPTRSPDIVKPITDKTR